MTIQTLKAAVAALLLLASAQLTAEGSVEFSDVSTMKWILKSLSIEYTDEDTQKTLFEKIKATLDSKITVTEIEDAFGKLQACRTSYSHLNLSIVSAEHYMFMRYRASDTGDTVWMLAPTEYKELKIKKIKEGRQDDLKTTDQPISPPDINVERWGIQGVSDGLKDYRRITKEEPSAGVSAYLEAIIFMVTARYKYADNRDCAIEI